MPIRINLLADDLNREEMRRKDPVKRAVLFGALAVFLVVLWGLALFLQLTIAKVELSSQEKTWNSMEKKVKEVEDNRGRVIDVNKRLSALTQFATNRFLWANVLNALQQTCADNIRLVRLKSDQNYTQIEAAKPPAGAPPTAAKPASSVERIALVLDGHDLNPQSSEQIPRFKEMILTQPYFKSCLHKTNSVLLTSLSAPVPEPGGRKSSYALFGLQLNFQEKERRLYE